MDDFLKKLWFDEPEPIIQEPKNKNPREPVKWFSAIYKDDEWYYHRKISDKEINIILRGGIIKAKLLHYRPVEDIKLAKYVTKRKRRKYQIEGTKKYALPQKLVDLALTLTH